MKPSVFCSWKWEGTILLSFFPADCSCLKISLKSVKYGRMLKPLLLAILISKFFSFENKWSEFLAIHTNLEQHSLEF